MDKVVEAVRVASDEVIALALVARQSAEQGRLDDARTLLEGLIVLEPQVANLHTCLGCVYMRMNRNEDALQSFSQALELDPRDVAAHTYAGELQLEGGHSGDGLAHLEAAIALDPEGRNAFANRARTLRVTAAAPSSAAARG